MSTRDKTGVLYSLCYPVPRSDFWTILHILALFSLYYCFIEGSDEYNDNIISETCFGQYLTIGALFIIVNLALSGGIYSWWKSAILTTGFLALAFIAIAFICFQRSGAMQGFVIPFSFRTLTAEDRNACWQKAFQTCIKLLYLTMPIYEVPS